MFANSLNHNNNHIYCIVLFLDSTYTQTWDGGVIETPDTFEQNDAKLNISLEMDSINQQVHMTAVIVEQGNGPYFYRAFAFSFPDVANDAYYRDGPPDGHYSDYINFVATEALADCTNAPHLNESAFNGLSTTQCDAIDPTVWRDCVYYTLPGKKATNLVTSVNNNVHTYTWDVEFRACGYEFSPAEFQTCRPLTMTSFAVRQQVSCLDLMDAVVLEPKHASGRIQINDFKTRAPTIV